MYDVRPVCMTNSGRCSSMQCSAFSRDFTGKERDAETGLDYFGARYYSGAQGRFLSVDPGNAGAVNEDPQSWNAYAYARDNPLKYVDPNGELYLICSHSNPNECKISTGIIHWGLLD
ncbi:MAG: RHS repeat-associated core domain-containing protein [Acidobacteria bacterium]|nr:RHS repeat-associated core domain-containing protein [Acidobacteriota bacterium]